MGQAAPALGVPKAAWPGLFMPSMCSARTHSAKGKVHGSSALPPASATLGKFVNPVNLLPQH